MKPTKLIQPNQFYLTKSRGENLEKNKLKFVPTLTWAWPSSAPTCYDLFILLKTFFLDGSLWLCAKFEIFLFISALSFSWRQDIGDWYLNRWPWMTVTDKFVLVSESFMQTFMAPFRIFLFLQQLMEIQGKFKYQKKFFFFNVGFASCCLSWGLKTRATFCERMMCQGYIVVTIMKLSSTTVSNYKFNNICASEVNTNLYYDSSASD